MTDDIVERLRDQNINKVICEEAAEEIERLQHDLGFYRADWRAMIDQTETLEHQLKNARKATKEKNE